MANNTFVQVISGGMLTTLQDLGRATGRTYGIPPSGAIDRFAHRAANQVLGNHPEAATLEITMVGPTLFFEDKALISLTGADLGPELDGSPVPMWGSVFVRGGQTLAFDGRRSGRVCYLGVYGGWEAPLVMGSRATYMRAFMGGINGEGRALKPGDTLTNGLEALRPLSFAAEGAARFYPHYQIPDYHHEVTVRIIPGPFQDNFDDETYTRLYSSSYCLSPQSDRMGYRLEGPALGYARPDLWEIAACGAVFGTIQVPADGQPIILMADHQLTGGYPIIGVVIEEDLPKVAQLVPGQTIRFKPHNWQ